MISINTFSLHSLLGVITLTPLAVGFCVTYLRLGRKPINGAIAYVIILNTALCLFSFIADNIVPAGLSSFGWEGGASAEQLARDSLLSVRLMWGTGVLILPGFLHFVLEYCERRGPLLRHIWAAYVAAGFAVILLWSPHAFRIAAEPLALSSSWEYPMPWMPKVGLLAAVVPVTCILLYVFSIRVLWQYRKHAAAMGNGAFKYWRLIWLAMLCPITIALSAMILKVVGYTGVSIIPVGAMTLGIILAIAVSQSYFDFFSELHQVQREKAALMSRLNCALIASREEERRTIAKDLHEGVAQTLVAMKMAFHTGSRQCAAKTHAADDVLQKNASWCDLLVREVRHLSHELYPADLEMFGLCAALEHWVEKKRDEGLNVSVESTGAVKDMRFRPNVEVGYFRIAQEVVRDITRRNRELPLCVKLRYIDGSLCMIVTDSADSVDPELRPEPGDVFADVLSVVASLDGELRISSQPERPCIKVTTRCHPLSATPALAASPA